MGVEHGLDLGRPDLEARAVDHALQAVGDEEVAVLVVVAEVAGAEKTLAVVLEEGLGGHLGLLPVAAKDLRAVDDDFSDFAYAKFLAGFHINDTGIGVVELDAAALALG